MDAVDLMAGANRSVVYHGTTDWTGRKAVVILVTEATIFENLEESLYDGLNGVTGAVDALTTAEQNIVASTTEVAAGTILKPLRQVFSRVKMVSGQCTGYER